MTEICEKHSDTITEMFLCAQLTKSSWSIFSSHDLDGFYFLS